MSGPVCSVEKVIALLGDVHGSPAAAAVVFLVLPTAWLVGSFIFSRVGGWHRLALRYPASTTRPPGVTCVSCTVWIGGMLGPTYGRLMNITLSSAGVYIRPKFTYRLFHPPVLLPWQCVQSVAEQRFLFFRWLEVRCVTDGPACRLYVPRSAAPIFNAEIAAARRNA